MLVWLFFTLLMVKLDVTQKFKICWDASFNPVLRRSYKVLDMILPVKFLSKFYS